MISKSGGQKQRCDQGWISWVGLGVQSMTIWLVEIQLMLKMSEPEEWILGSDWGLRAFATYWINGLKKIMTKGANKILRLMGLIIMLVSKNFKSNRLLKIFGRSNDILNTFVKYLNQLGMSGYLVSARIIRRGYSCGKNCKAVGTKYSRINRGNFRVSCNDKINWEQK